jgi:NAD(P)H-hydrate epimerase
MNAPNSFRYITLEECQSYLLPRPREAHKGNFGHVLIVGGDYGMAGSVRLSGEAALRSGAGLVSIATRPEHAFAISGACPELMARGVFDAKEIEPLLERATVVVVGPGLGKDNWGKSLLESVLKTTLPLVVDADALNQLADTPRVRDNWILTPHPGEAARLLQQTVSEVQKNRILAIQLLQQRYQGISVLKGTDTLILGNLNITDCCQAGNPGMATGGMGDVLSGVIAALVAQGLSLHQAASLGVCAHATAGDSVATKTGQRGMMARDLLQEIRLCLNPHKP